jgi:pimeloyl-ACP methyl ester carboxylesterase
MTFPYITETKDLTDAVRAQTSGSFVRLGAGTCHYEISNSQSPSRGTVVLVHGFSVPYFIWDPTFAFLTQAGFRVLRFDLFGRGYSDRPNTQYTIDLFVRQLHDLLDALDLREPVHLTGLSMGGGIAVHFTDRHPERVAKLILVDPAGAKRIELSAVDRMVRIPGLAELFFGLLGDGNLIKGLALDFFDPKLVEQFVEQYRPQMKFKGFKRAIISTLRNNVLGDHSAAYRRVGERGKPTLLFWGRNDTTVPFEHHSLVTGLIPQTELHIIEGAGHIPHYEKPGEVNPILLDFLKK